jgi:hypothetical protein
MLTLLTVDREDALPAALWHSREKHIDDRLLLPAAPKSLVVS